jgi:hypothetical protein
LLLDRNKKVLEYNFVLWKYDTTKLDHASLAKLDKGSKEAEDPDQLEFKIKDKQCCSIF